MQEVAKRLSSPTGARRLLEASQQISTHFIGRFGHDMPLLRPMACTAEETSYHQLSVSFAEQREEGRTRVGIGLLLLPPHTLLRHPFWKVGERGEKTRERGKAWKWCEVRCGLWVMGYGLWVMGCVLWVMVYGLWVVVS